MQKRPGMAIQEPCVGRAALSSLLCFSLRTLYNDLSLEQLRRLCTKIVLFSGMSQWLRSPDRTQRAEDTCVPSCQLESWGPRRLGGESEAGDGWIPCEAFTIGLLFTPPGWEDKLQAGHSSPAPVCISWSKRQTGSRTTYLWLDSCLYFKSYTSI